MTTNVERPTARTEPISPGGALTLYLALRTIATATPAAQELIEQAIGAIREETQAHGEDDTAAEYNAHSRAMNACRALNTMLTPAAPAPQRLHIVR